MAITIDQLELEIIDNSGSVVDGLERLQAVLNDFKSVAGLNKSAKQIESFAASINKLGSMGKLRELANALTAIGSVPKANISASLGNQIMAISTAAANVDIGALGNLKLLQEGLQHLTRLGKPQLGSFITQLKKLPEVALELEKVDMNRFAASLQKVTTVLAPLASEMNKISLGFSALPSKIQKVISSNERLAMSNGKSGKSFGAMGTGISSLQAKFGIYYMLAKRAANTMGGWVSESNAYVENLNLFTVSMGKYADKSLKYAESVQSVMGIDMSEWIRNQGIFMQIGTGFGVVADKAAIMSKGLTQIAYDMSSYFNADITTALEKVQSGFAGELEPLRRWGYALDQATLQQLALKNGITQSINTMTQAQKSQLRYVAIMEQSKNVMGDMGRTLGTPANAMRILGQQVTQLTRALGNMLIPILIQIVPYVQAFVMVLTDAAQAIARLFGFTLPTIDYSGLEGLSTGAENASEGLGDATKAAKALKGATMGFDELNILNPDTGTTGAGGTDGTSGGDLGLDLKDYDFLGNVKSMVAELKQAMQQFFDGFTKNPAIKWLGDTFKFIWEKGVKPLGTWIVKNPDKVADFLIGIGVAIATYKLVTTISNVAKAMSGTTGLLAGLQTLSGMGGTPKILTGLAGILTNPWALAIAAVAGGFVLVAGGIATAKRDAINADLAKRFGDISLSMEEVKAAADRMTFTKAVEASQNLMAELGKLDGIKESIKTSVDELNVLDWKISVGLLLTEGEQEQYKSAADAMVSNSQAYIQQQGYATTVGLDLIFEPKSENYTAAFETIGNIQTKFNDELVSLGEQLKAAINRGFEDGTLQLDEQKEIQAIRQQIQDMMNVVADGEFTARLDFMNVKYAGTALTEESYTALQAELGEMIAQRKIDIQNAMQAELSNLSISLEQAKMTYKGSPLEENAQLVKDAQTMYDAAVAASPMKLRSELEELEIIADKYNFNTLNANFKTELEKLSPIISTTTADAFEGMVEAGFNTKDLYSDTDFGMQRIVSQLQNEYGAKIKELDIDAPTRGAIEKMIAAFEPTKMEYEKIVANALKTGEAVPKYVSEGLTNQALLEAITGDSNSILFLIGQQLSTDQAFLDLIATSKNAGDQVGANVLAGLKTQLDPLKEQGRGLILDLKNATQESVESNAKIFKGMGETLAKEIIKGFNAKISSFDFNVSGKTSGFKIPAYATGGFPEDGLFMANHGELVGQFSNGRTAVANNDQIVEGIAGGVAEGNDNLLNAIYAMTSRVVKAIEEQDSNVYLDTTKVSRKVTEAQKKLNREAGISFVKGGAI